MQENGASDVTEPSTITKDVPVRLVMNDANVLLTAEFSYTTADPCAVQVVFNTGIDGEVVWTFSRELLKDGLEGKAGTGDVRLDTVFGVFNPAMGGFGSHDKLLTMQLISPYGKADFVMNHKLVTSFVKDVFRLVPEDSIEERLNLDGVLASILAEEEGEGV